METATPLPHSWLGAWTSLPAPAMCGTSRAMTQGPSASSWTRRGPALLDEHRFWLPLGVGVGLAAAKTRYAPQPRVERELMGLSMLNKDPDLVGEDFERRKAAAKALAGEADESWAFWEEQKTPTPGLSNKPRDKVAAELPSPLPSLEPPTPLEGDDTLDQETSFKKAYGSDATIMGTDGEPLEVPRHSTFQEAVEEFGYPAFLKAALARRGFYYLTPVQQCSLPLFRGGHDFMASAFTGSGKTSAYLLPILKSLHE
ncbi:ATP-dependent RNA helicase glh-2 (Germline helicase 2), partial [Durusdinium trenchii]